MGNGECSGFVFYIGVRGREVKGRGSALVLLSTWAYVRYSGEHRELGGYIDKLTDIVWKMVSSRDRDGEELLILINKFA